MNDTPDFYLGTPVDSEDLWFRDEFIERLWETLEGNHAILKAPRRTGKSSVMNHLVDHPQNDFTPVPAFVQDLDHPAEFIMVLMDAFHDRYPNHFRELFEGSSKLISNVLGMVQEVGVSGFKVALRKQDPDWDNNWKKHGEEFFNLVRKSQRRVLFVVDEFPDLILSMNREHPDVVKPFLAWFRGHRQSPRPKNDSIRWLLGGSVNLSSTLESMDSLDKINDVSEEALPVLTEDQVVEFVTRMLEGRSIELEEGFAEAVAGGIGRPIPLFLQMITQDLARLGKKEKRPLLKDDFQRAYNDMIVSSTARDKLQHFYARIRLYYLEPKRSAAYDILSKLALLPDGMHRDTILTEFQRVMSDADQTVPRHELKQQFNQLLNDLENDFYIEEIQEGKYDFSSGLLKAWWGKYYA